MIFVVVWVRTRVVIGIVARVFLGARTMIVVRVEVWFRTTVMIRFLSGVVVCIGGGMGLLLVLAIGF